ncbi:cell division protein ZapA [Pseudaeromonas paramecii]|uniref:Cell division protein ZapA n=1 Tax=Pseudaeromonas paramecii TaxID=2138166 RepID=A0ABP8Q511_9GAMM
MTVATESIELTILGRVYKISCLSGQSDALKAAADGLNQHLNEMRQRSRGSNNEQLAVMAALHFCYELGLEKASNRKYSETMDERIKMLQQTIETALLEQGRQLRG